MTPSRPWRALLAAALLLSAAAGAWAGVTKGKGLELWIDEKWPDSVQAGYTPVRVTVSNSLPETRNLTIVLTTPGAASTVSRIERTFSVEAEKAVQFTVHVPATGNYSYYEADVVERGREIVDLRQRVDLRSSHGHDSPSLLIISDSPEDVRQLTACSVFSAVPGGGDAMMQMRSEQLPQGWIGYTRIGIVGVAAATLEAMPPARRDDLRKWVAAGGTLFVYRPVPGGLSPLRLLLGAESDTREVAPHYFGRIHVLASDPFPGASGDWTALLNRLGAQNATFSRRYGFRTVGEDPRINIPGLGDVPVRGYAVMVTLFAILIGPVNYFLLKWKRKLHLLFILTPAVAVVVTLAMAAYGLLSEGLGVKGAAYSLTWLDQDRHEAVTLGTMGIYAGMSPGGGLSFPMDVAVFPRGGDMSGGALELSDTQRFTGGFARARTVLSYSTARVAPARARVRIQKQGKTLTVTNGLEVAITRMHVMDEDGAIYALDGIEPGAASSRATVVTRPPNTQTALVRATGIPLAKHARLREGMFVADLAESPYFLTGLASLRQLESRHVLIGHFTEASDARQP
ncbi:hypothetical protein HQ560_15490 [bacterium]|nr:hypothetical protein [bacterium]